MEIERMKFGQEEDDSQARGERKANKRIQDYKDTMSLIKLKMNKADALIRQYNDKIKECNILNEEKQEILKKYNLTMEKLAQLELMNIEYKESCEYHKDLIDKQKIKLDENEQHINQLIFKVKNTEEQNSTLEDKIKALQLDIKTAKKVVKCAEKKSTVQLKEQSSQTISHEKRNTSMNTDSIKVVPNNFKMIDKHVMTDQCLSMQKEPFPIFCTKCEMCIIPTPVEQILKVMSLSPPFLSEHLSPPNSPRLIKPRVEISELLESTSTALENNEVVPNESDSDECKKPIQITEELQHVTFMEIDKLTRKINKLEKLIKKRKTKKKSNNCFHKNCCISKNIKFILQMPSEKKFFKYRKRDKHKLKWLKSKYKKNIIVDEGVNNFIWQIEDRPKAIKRKMKSDENSETSSKKRKYFGSNDIDLFESSEVCVRNKASNDYLNEDFCKSEKTYSSSKCSEASDCTSPSEITDVNEKESPIEDVTMTEFAAKLNGSSCCLSTSQISHSENICYSNDEKEIVQKENFVFDKMSEDITYNIPTLPIRLESIEKNIYEEEDSKTQSNSFANKETNNSYDIDRFIKNVKIVNNQTNENCISFNEYSMFNIKSDILDKSIPLCSHENINEQQNNKQNNNSWASNDKSESNNLSNTLELAVSIKDSEECEESRFNQKSQDNALLLQGSNEALCCSGSVSTTKSNIMTEYTKNPNEDGILVNETPIANLHSNASYLSIKNATSEDVNNKQKERKENSDFHESGTVPNETSNKFCSEITTTTVYPTNHDKIEEMENFQATSDNTRLKDLHTLPVTSNNTERGNDSAAQSIIEIKEPKSFIKESNDFFDINVNNINEVNSISMNEDVNVSLSTTLDDVKKRSKSIDEYSTDETFDKQTLKPRSPRTRNELNKTCNANLAGGTRKKLLSKIRNLSRNSKKPMVLNNLESGSLQVREKPNAAGDSTLINNSHAPIENIPIIEQPKKQRIAHTPKTFSFSINNESSSQVAHVAKRAKVLSKEPMEDKNDKVSIIIKEIDKTFKTKAKAPCTPSAPPSDPASTPLSQEEETRAYGTGANEANNLEYQVNDCDERLAKPLSESVVLSEIRQKSPEMANTRENQCFGTVFNFQDNLSSDEHESAYNNATKNLKVDVANGNNNENKSPVRELRSRQITINKELPVRKKLYVKKLAHPKLITSQNSGLLATTVISILNAYLSNPNETHKYFKNKEISQFKHNEQFIMEQLESLMKLDDWTIELHSQVMDNLMTLQDFRYIALFIIEYIIFKMSDDEAFDKTHTPPAPMMTRSEQKLVTLILEIDKKVPNFSEVIIKGIQFRLFRLGVSQEVQIVERLFRILVVLNKIKKDRDKVRIFCCDALYCLKLRAVNIIYVALMCWPEVLPKYDSNNDVIVKTIVHIIMSLKVTKPFPKLYSLKTLLFKYYNYPDSGYTPSLIKDELLRNLRENTPGVNTAMLLLCKSMGPAWAIENIIKELKQIIVTQNHPSLYEVLTLLGNILRPIRIETTYSEIVNIINQLCDVLDSNAGSDELQEGVVSCLISISKFKYKQVARSVLKWQFNKDVRPTTNDKLKSFFLCQDTKWWWQFVQSNFPRPQQD